MSALLTLFDDGGFNPRSLFAAGEQGIWLDPSDFSTLFQDAAGTTPVTALGQPVGLMLDKRLGLALRPENIVNGDFSAGSTGWTNPDTAPSVTTFSGGAATLTAAAGGQLARLRQSLTLPAGTYLVSVNVVAVTGTPADGTLAIGNALSGDLTYGSIDCRTVGLKTRLVHISGPTLGLAFTTSSASGAVIVIDNVSVKLLAGNHAYQTTSASRPTVEARVNLLTYSEQMDNAAWLKAAGTISANSTTAPDGTLTADLFTESTVNAQHYVLQNAVSGTGRATLTFHVKPNGRTRVGVRSEQPQLTGLSARFDLTGSGSVVSGTGTITALANGWYRCTATSAGNGNGDSGYHIIQPLGPADADVYTGDGVSGIYIWGAQLETGTAFTTYQKVNTATDYVDVGFPRYLQFDGIDDFLVTPSVNFTGTDKMTVWAGAKANSAAANAVLFELSTTFGAGNPGSMGVLWPRLPYAVNFGLAGTAAASRSTSAVADTVLRVISSVFDISSASTVDEIKPRVNGAEPSLLTVDAGPAGTGNYGNYPLYIGRRGGTSLPFNGRLYQLIIRGAASSDVQIAATEAYVNAKTRAY